MVLSIGNVGGLGTSQLRALNRLSQLSSAIADNTLRLSTLKRINSAKDDPSGLVQVTRLEQALAAAETASQGVTRASAILNTADVATGEIVSQLQAARVLALEAAGGSLSASEVAGNQIQIDAILSAVDSASQTEFGGRRLLDGSAGFRTSGANTAEVLDVDVVEKSTADDVTVSIDVTSQATQAAATFTDADGSLDADTTVIIDGPDGTTTISLTSGDDTQTITDAFNSVAAQTGITATRVDANQIDFQTADFGSDASISVEATEGAFALTGLTAGTDAVATINGQQFTGDGSTFNVFTPTFSAVVELDPTASGTLTSFTISGAGLNFIVGSSPTNTARVGLPTLNTSSLGGVDGKLISLRSGNSNSLTSGNAVNAVRIIEDAISDVTRAQAVIGGFQKFTLDSASRVLGGEIENVSSTLSAVRDTDIALETALLARNQLLQQTTLNALSISSLQNRDILNLLRLN